MTSDARSSLRPMSRKRQAWSCVMLSVIRLSSAARRVTTRLSRSMRARGAARLRRGVRPSSAPDPGARPRATRRETASPGASARRGSVSASVARRRAGGLGVEHRAEQPSLGVTGHAPGARCASAVGRKLPPHVRLRFEHAQERIDVGPPDRNRSSRSGPTAARRRRARAAPFPRRARRSGRARRGCRRSGSAGRSRRARARPARWEAEGG